MNPNIPEKYQAIVLPDYNPNFIRAMLSMKIEEKKMRQPQKDEVLVKMIASPCNPSDIAFMQGGYNIKKEVPVVPGFEGAGLVVATGDSPEAVRLKGRRLSCFTQNQEDGTWGEYFITAAGNCIPLRDDLPDEEAAVFGINPFTAYGLFEKARLNKSTAIIQNAAGSQVSNFVRKLAAKGKVEVIDIVRKEKTQKELVKQGAKHVLNSSADDFADKLKDLAHLLNATTALDAVSGEMTGVLYNAMPPGSEVIVYGGLAGKPAYGMDVLDIIFKNKIISGFNLGDYIKNTGPERFQEISEELQQMLIAGDLKTQIRGRFPLEKYVDALKSYLGNMSEGKILLVNE